MNALVTAPISTPTVLAPVKLPIEMVLALALVPILMAPVVPESSVYVDAAAILTLTAPLAVRTVLEPREMVPEPACIVKLPAVVLHVLAAAPVSVRAPAEVVRLEAAFPLRETAPPLVVSEPTSANAPVELRVRILLALACNCKRLPAAVLLMNILLLVEASVCALALWPSCTKPVLSTPSSVSVLNAYGVAVNCTRGVISA